MKNPNRKYDILAIAKEIIQTVVGILIIIVVVGFFITIINGIFAKDARSTENKRSVDLVTESRINDNCKLQVWHYNYGSERFPAWVPLYVTSCNDTATIGIQP